MAFLQLSVSVLSVRFIIQKKLVYGLVFHPVLFHFEIFTIYTFSMYFTNCIQAVLKLQPHTILYIFIIASGYFSGYSCNTQLRSYTSRLLM